MTSLPDPPAKRHQALLEHYFWRVPEQASVKTGFDVFTGPDFAVTDDELPALFAHTMRQSGTGLADLTNDQLGIGLIAMFSMQWSDMAYRLQNAPAYRQGKTTIPIAQQCAALASIATLYAACLTPRAQPARGLRHEASGPLGYFAYMVWDASPLGYWRGAGPKDPRVRALLDILADALESPNPVCIKSALHGLGHLGGAASNAKREIINDFLARRSGELDSSIVKYALAAGEGSVQ